jgi:hypothetical protein
MVKRLTLHSYFVGAGSNANKSRGFVRLRTLCGEAAELTRMADLGVAPHVVEALLNHISGPKAGVAAIYNRATCGPRNALRSICGPTTLRSLWRRPIVLTSPSCADKQGETG